MLKATPKKKVTKKKVAVKKAVKKVQPPKKYHVVMKFNGVTHEFETDDLRESILNVRPIFLKTKILMTITLPDGRKCEKQLFVLKGKMLFRNEMFLQTFIRFLIFK